MSNRFAIKPTFHSSLSHLLDMPKVRALLLATLLLLGTTTAMLSPLYTAKATGYDYTQSDTIGTPVTMHNPTAFDIDGSGNYYVADAESYLIRKYNSAGQELLSFGPGDYSTLPEEFGWIEGIAVKSNGDIYVTDGDNLRVQVYSSTGQYLRTVGDTVFDGWPNRLTFDSAGKLYVSDGDAIRVFDSSDNLLMTIGSSGTGDGEFSNPNDMDVDTNGDIYVLDSGNARVQVFDAAGTFLREFGSYSGSSDGDVSPELFQFPDSIKIHPDGNLRILDRDRVKTFTKTGTYISKFGANGYEPSQFSGTYYLGITSDGKIHTLEGGIDRIQVFDASGTYQFQFGNGGSDTSQFFGPISVATDSSDNIYVVDTLNNRVQKFASDGTFLLQWGGIGTGNGQFNRPRSIAINNSTNRVYVSEWSSISNPTRIQIFDLNGTYISQFGSSGSGDGQFNASVTVAIGPSGTVYTADVGANRVQAFDANGTFLRKWTVDDFPTGIATDASENVYVINDDTSHIYKYSSTGTLLSTFGGASNGTGDGELTSAAGITVDDDGIIYVADAGNHRVQIFDTDGTFLHKFGTQGDGDNQFGFPQDLALDSNMRLIIGDDDNNRIAIYSLGPVATAPSEPQNVAADVSAPNQAAISWTTPASDGGAAITNYTLEYKLAADSSWTSINVTAPTTNRTLTSLTAGQYNARLSATNSVGTSATTTPITFTVIDPTPPASAPSSPQSVTVDASSANTMVVNWQAPSSDGGGVITSYLLEYKKTSDSSWASVTVTAPTTTRTLTGLSTGDYQVRLSATNSAGTGSASGIQTASVTDPPAAPAGNETPSSPASSGSTSESQTTTSSGQTTDDSINATDQEQQAIGAVEQSEPGKVLVTWEAPAGTTPDNYVIEYRNASIPDSDTSTPWHHAVQVGPGQRSATITLPAGDYNIRVAAIFPGEAASRVILGVARVKVTANTIMGDAQSQTSTPDTNKPAADNTLRNWVVAACTALLTLAFFFIVIAAWKRRRKKAAATVIQLPPRRL